ncbi:Uncharacterised protein [Mesomycoplasma conjunctivae]|uniref:Methyltransferase n=1 Tax=Mesomycoplasma conjunctivae (strain ATCC 25834 / NCTC 10147 / HRC/581) TaxID=572263 RepID=C5J7E3_MESCH|nr:hypothetical protein [Mesomycoplasma conjunctivae]CAT05406.1 HYPOTHETICAL PROTEIN MCJ_007240 [Mesomycoplasma conjunctivae]VEU66631.1 Uncharacterised protein [Mesomycoplasma conjunctivae]
MNPIIRNILIVSIFAAIAITVITLIISNIKKNKIVKKYQQLNNDKLLVEKNIKINDIVNQIQNTNLIVEEVEFILNIIDTYNYKKPLFLETDGLLSILSAKMNKINTYILKEHLILKQFEDHKKEITQNNIIILDKPENNYDFIYLFNSNYQNEWKVLNFFYKLLDEGGIFVIKLERKNRKNLLNDLKYNNIKYYLDYYFNLIIIKKEKSIKI